VIVVLIGPSGCGKTTVGRALAASLAWAFVDADDLHSPEARAKMAAGTPLDDADRAPWLARVAARLVVLGSHVVLACSALRASYREVLRRAADDVRCFLLDAPRAVLEARMRARDHFMPVSLLDSQLATLERGDDLIELDATRPAEALVEQLRLAVA
jgi:carbohydrate kinase (thermoresistant glucokinase family)